MQKKSTFPAINNIIVVVARLESPTRSLLMEAPKGIQILAEAGDIKAICRNELRLESKDGEVSWPTGQPITAAYFLRRTQDVKCSPYRCCQPPVKIWNFYNWYRFVSIIYCPPAGNQGDIFLIFSLFLWLSYCCQHVTILLQSSLFQSIPVQSILL